MSPSANAERLVVYTCITGGYDIPLESPWAQRCPHICFTDDARLTSETWEIRRLEGPGLDAARRSRLPKILPHRYLPDFDVSLWIDASARLLKDPVSVAARALERGDFAAFRHPRRDCAYVEVEECLRRGKDAPERLRRQAETYRRLGLPDHVGLYEATVLLRRHHAPPVVAAMERWWEQIVEHSCRDQVSLPYVVWQDAVEIQLQPSRLEPDPVYRLRKHFRDRSPTRRAWIRLVEWYRRLRTRWARLRSANAP